MNSSSTEYYSTSTEVSPLSEQKRYYGACEAYCEPIKIIWLAILMFVGVPFNICVIYTLLKSRPLRENFVSIYLSTITCINMLLLITVVLLFFFDKKYRIYRAEHDCNDVAHDYLLFAIKILMMTCVVETTSIHWMTVVLTILRVYRLVYPKSCLCLYRNITIVCTCAGVIVCSVVWYQLLVWPKVDISKRKTVAIIFHIYSYAGRLQLALVMFIVPSVIVIVINILMVVSFKYRLLAVTVINDPDLHARIVRNMTLFVFVKSLQWLILLMPFSVFLIFLQEYSDRVPYDRQQIIVICLFLSFVTDSLVNSLKYCVSWGLFRMELGSNLWRLWGCVLRRKQVLVYETIKQREKMIRMLMRRTDENTLSSKDSVMSNGTLYGSDLYDPALDMFMTRFRRRGARTTTHIAIQDDVQRYSEGHEKHRTRVVEIANKPPAFAENYLLVDVGTTSVKSAKDDHSGTHLSTRTRESNRVR